VLKTGRIFKPSAEGILPPYGSAVPVAGQLLSGVYEHTTHKPLAAVTGASSGIGLELAKELSAEATI